MSSHVLDSLEVRQAFAEHDRQVTVSNFKVACVLGMLLMPAGILLDRYVYAEHPELLAAFLKMRFVCSALIFLFLGLLLTPIGHRHYRFLGVTLFMLPASFIAWMIYASPDGAASPYYAGLNLVLLVLAYVLHWTFWESICAASLVILLYVAASLAHGPISKSAVGEFANNMYFLVLTGIIVVTGSYFHSKTRFREFAFRYELDKSRKALEVSNEKLVTQNQVLEDTNRTLESTITELNQTRDKLVQSEKMASLGRMSAGIIHEINNPLNYANSGLFALSKKGKHLPPEQRQAYDETVTDIQDGINRVNNIVSNLRVFTHPLFHHPDTSSLPEVRVAEVAAEAIRCLSHLAPPPMRIVNAVPEDYTVPADRQKLGQVIENLVRNSLDALATKTFVDEPPTIWIEGRAEKNRRLIVVRDNGPGIPPQDREKVFDPFFTTKDVGKGMGLGLTVCLGIVQAFGGTITTHSEPGKFCEFLLEFPGQA